MTAPASPVNDPRPVGPAAGTGPRRVVPGEGLGVELAADAWRGYLREVNRACRDRGLAVRAEPGSGLGAWEPYQQVLGLIEAPIAEQARARSLWEAARDGRPRPVRPPRPRLRSAAEPTALAEIRAGSAGEFAGLLRLLLDRSGLTVAEFARQAGISRSQVYALTQTGRGSLPLRVEQVRTFAEFAGLPDAQADAVVSLWEQLHRTRRFPAPSTATPAGAPDAPTPVPTRRTRVADLLVTWGPLVVVVAAASALSLLAPSRTGGLAGFLGVLLLVVLLGPVIERRGPGARWSGWCGLRGRWGWWRGRGPGR
jgi:hypothetical protein